MKRLRSGVNSQVVRAGELSRLGDSIGMHHKNSHGLHMANFRRCPAAIAVLFWAAATSSMGASSAASSASEGMSASIGSISGSVQKSSGSSSRATDVAEGNYEVIDVAAVPERPGIVRLKMQAQADHGAGGEVFLFLPQGVVDQSHLAQGRIVLARQRPYGVEFADGRTQQAFFLVLDDDWYRELHTKAVEL
jgi:hypothetical protein